MIALRHLRYFVAVGEELNFNRAAERVHVTQPALWRQIRDLEQYLGVALLDRQPRGIRLTPAGEVMLEESIKILDSIDDARERVIRVAQGQIGILRIAFNEIAARNRALPRYFQAFRLRYPDIELQLTVLMSERQFLALERNEIDAGFLFNRPRDDTRLGYFNVSKDDHVLALPADHRLARADKIVLSDLRDEPQIFPSKTLNRIHHARLTAACVAAGLIPRIAHRADNEHTLLNMVSAGMGVAFVNASCRTRDYNDLVLKPIENFSIPVDLDLVWRADRMSAALSRFVELVTELSGDAGSRGRPFDAS
ncbi:LysR substrate-binding domain-containing protein [Microvirga antarctica]|uniref:LysR substrate-binding domain-containing protein n=1 Tax=Microvirga antarctica TaxID=2819233 RepID=UPI001B3127FA|nr:LysR substrate-binding domain-containing protein [Microvirga antarctica]